MRGEMTGEGIEARVTIEGITEVQVMTGSEEVPVTIEIREEIRVTMTGDTEEVLATIIDVAIGEEDEETILVKIGTGTMIGIEKITKTGEMRREAIVEDMTPETMTRGRDEIGKIVQGRKEIHTEETGGRQTEVVGEGTETIREIETEGDRMRFRRLM
jgi:hypothetical protein